MATLGALVVSLDFELYWGVSDQRLLDDAEKSRLLSARNLVDQHLDLFKEFGIHATWATVGMLFASSREEAESFKPTVLPSYADPRLDPFQQQLGNSEEEDPYHFAPSLIERIRRTPGQEVASHSFSHYYGMEEGQSCEHFAADLKSAVEIAKHKGYKLSSFVFPRNQVNAAYLPVLAQMGFNAYRDNEEVAIKQTASFDVQQKPYKRLGRLLDAYCNLFGDQCATWETVGGIACCRASRYLRSYAPWNALFRPLLLRRIKMQMDSAAQAGKVFHLWWHPEDFAMYPKQNMQVLREILMHFHQLQQRGLMQTLTMLEFATQALDASRH